MILIWNIIVFFTYGADKRAAVKKRRRISEKTLLCEAFLMGAAGAVSGMCVFRHKTRKTKFKILIFIACIFNIAVFFVIYRSIGIKSIFGCFFERGKDLFYNFP